MVKHIKRSQLNDDTRLFADVIKHVAMFFGKYLSIFLTISLSLPQIKPIIFCSVNGILQMVFIFDLN